MAKQKNSDWLNAFSQSELWNYDDEAGLRIFHHKKKTKSEPKGNS
jgi:hypothetical protein